MAGEVWRALKRQREGALVREHADVFGALPAAVHEGTVRAYVAWGARSCRYGGRPPAGGTMGIATQRSDARRRGRAPGLSEGSGKRGPA